MNRCRAIRGDKLECPQCHRRVGYWPDKDDYHVGHLMRHRERDDGLYGHAWGPWCDGTTCIG